MRLTIGRRIGALVLVMLALLGAVSLVSYWAMADVGKAMHERKLSYDTSLQLDRVLSGLLNAETGQRGYLLTGNDAYLDPYLEASRGLDAMLAELRGAAGSDPQDQAIVARIEPLIRAKFAAMQDAVDARWTGGADAALAALGGDRGKAAMDAIRNSIGELAAHQLTLLDLRSNEADHSALTADRAIAATGLLSLVLAILASLLVTRSITGPLGALLEGVRLVGSGGLDHRIEVSANDEIGDLAQAFNAMTANLEASGARLTAVAEQRAKVLAAVTETVQQLGSASQELLTGATQQAAGMQQQAAAVAETVTVVDEVAHTATQAADRAKFVATSARRTEEVGATGRRAVDETVQVINEAKSQSDSVARNIATLAGHTQAIGEIVALISDIAEQTNLLALNAAIEASRAGEHGRGFSVVAAEVKALADESKQATRRVRQILSDIQKMANTSVLSTEESARSMATATRQAASAGETIQALGDVIAEVAQAAAQIAASAGQQATGLTQIHQAMRDIKQVSAQNIAATQQAQRAATDLAEMGVNLRALLATSRQSDG